MKGITSKNVLISLSLRLNLHIVEKSPISECCIVPRIDLMGHFFESY